MSELKWEDSKYKGQICEASSELWDYNIGDDVLGDEITGKFFILAAAKRHLAGPIIARTDTIDEAKDCCQDHHDVHGSAEH